MTTLSGTPIVERPNMAGAKKAVRIGDGPIYVSPAMWHLLETCETASEFQRLLMRIPLVRLPAIPPGKRA